MATKREAKELQNAIIVIRDECNFQRGKGTKTCSMCPFVIDLAGAYDFCGIVGASMTKEWRKAPQYWEIPKIRLIGENEYTKEIMFQKD